MHFVMLITQTRIIVYLEMRYITPQCFKKLIINEHIIRT